MSLLALNASLGSAPPPAEHPREFAGKSGGGAEFGAIVSALAGEDGQANAREVGMKSAASAQDSASASEVAQQSQAPSINPGLAGLVYGALASPAGATPGRFVPRGAVAQHGAASAQDGASPSEAAQQSQASSIDPGLAGLVDSALASPAAATSDRSVTRSGDAHQGAAAANAAAAAIGAAGAQDSASASEAAPRSQAPSIDPGLAGLVYGPLASPAGASSGRSVTRSGDAQQGAAAANAAAAAKEAASAQDSASAREAAPQSQPSSIDPGLAVLVYGALASAVAAPPSQFAAQGAEQQGAAAASAAAGGATRRALAGRDAHTSADQPSGASAAVAAPAPLAEKATATNFALPGVVNAPSTIQMAANGGTALGVRAVRTRTYLGVESAAKSGARNPLWRSQTGSDAAALPAEGGAAAASIGNGSPPDKRSTSGHAPSPDAAPSDASGARAVAAIGSGAAADVASLGANATAAGSGSIAVSQLADRIATAASELTSSAAAPAATAAAGAGAAQAVKELEIELDPADLGAVSVKMRLVEGKLSVVMEVATPATQKAIENERDAITERLGSAGQPLETLIIKPAATNQANTESDDARNGEPRTQENAQSDPNRGSQGNGQQPSRRDGAADQRNSAAMARQPASGRGFGDLVV